MKLKDFIKEIDPDTFQPQVVCTCIFPLEIIDDSVFLSMEELESMIGKEVILQLSKGLDDLGTTSPWSPPVGFNRGDINE
jgi:hypothetical protein